MAMEITYSKIIFSSSRILTETTKRLKSEQVYIFLYNSYLFNLILDDLGWKHKPGYNPTFCGRKTSCTTITSSLHKGPNPPSTCPYDHWEPVTRSPLEFYYIKIDFIPILDCEKLDNSGNKCKFTTNKGGRALKYHTCMF